MSREVVTRTEERTPSRRDYATAGVVTLIVMLTVGCLFYWRMTSPEMNLADGPRLGGAVRAGTPEFESLRESIVVDDLVATKSPRSVGDVVMELTARIRNNTGRAISALEVRGAVVDSAGRHVRERTVIVMPAGRTKLPPDGSVSVHLLLEDVDKEVEQGDVRMEVAGVRFD